MDLRWETPAMRDEASAVRVAPGASLHVLPSGGMSLIHPDRRRIFVFNHSAHLLWRALRLGAGVCLPHILVSRYGIPLAVAERDVEAIVAHWIANGLAVVSDPIGEDDPAGIALPSDASGVCPRGEPRLFRIGTLVFSVSADAPIEAAITPLFSHLCIDAGVPDVVCAMGASGAGQGSLVIDGRVVIDGVEEHMVLGAFYQAILERLHPGARWRAMMHAGAVAKNGVAAIVPSPSGSGKSTLTAYLVARGYDYLSDDLVPLLAQDDAVAPFPLPISVKPGAAPILAPFYPALDGDARGGTQFLVQNTSFLAPTRRAKALVFPRYVRGAPTRFQSLSVQEAFVRLLSDRVYLGCPIEDAALRGFIGWLRRVGRYELNYCDLEEAEHCVSRALMV
jgi:hypothetical protein